MEKINIYCGWHRNTIIKIRPKLIKQIFLEVQCLECHGMGIFDCGIEKEKGICIQCKGTGKQCVGMI